MYFSVAGSELIIKEKAPDLQGELIRNMPFRIVNWKFGKADHKGVDYEVTS